jgi:uncharacterized protein (DUF302 family)
MFITVRSKHSIGEVRQRFEDTNIRISGALPCRVSIYVDGEEVVLETIKPTMMLRMFNEPALETTAREVETAIEEIMREAAK